MNTPLLQSMRITVIAILSLFIFFGVVSKAKAQDCSITPAITASGPTTICNGGSVRLSSFPSSAPGNALQLNGVNQYFITPDLAASFPSKSVTIELWFKANAAGVIVDELGQQTINTSWHDSQIEILSTGQVKVRVWEFTPIVVGTVAFGEWHHVVVRYNANTSVLDGFLDGVRSTSITGERFSSAAQYYAFGVFDNQNMGSGNYFNGQLDEIRIWNVARTNSEIENNYHGSVPVNSSNLIAYYKLDETTGSIAGDATTNGYNGSLINSPLWIAVPGGVINPYASYLWSPGGETTSGINVTTSGTYTVTVTDANGCTGTVSQTVTVQAPQVVGSNNVTICPGSSATLNVTGASGYNWSPSTGLNQTTGATVIASPAVTTVYTISATDAVNCTTTVTVNVKPITTPTITASGPTTFCEGEQVTLTASNATKKYYIGASDLIGLNTLCGTNTRTNGCNGVSAGFSWMDAGLGTPVSIQVTISIGRSFFPGFYFNQNTTLNGVAGTTFMSGGGQNIACDQSWLTPLDINATGYIVGGTNTFMINNLPGCWGLSANNETLNGYYAVVTVAYPYSSYQWSNGATTKSISVSTSGNYSVTGSFDGCTLESAVVPVTVKPKPVVSIQANVNGIICPQTPVTLTASGAGNYNWQSFPASTSAGTIDDITGVKLAAGLRKLFTTYSGAAIRLRRSTDNAETDIGFTGLGLDINAVTTFLQGGTGYCTKLYDQSGNGNDMVQATAANQPVLVLNGLNVPVLHFADGRYLRNSLNPGSNYSVVYGAKQTGPARKRVLSSVSNNWLLGWWGGKKGMAFFEGWVAQTNAPADNDFYIYSCTGNGTTSQVFENGDQIASNALGLAAPNGIQMNGSGVFNEFSDVDIYDVIVTGNVLSTANRTAIESSIRNYYNSSQVLGDQNPLLVNPDLSTFYYVTGTTNGCSSIQNILLQVKPIGKITASQENICRPGTDIVTLTSTPAQSYLWNTGATTQSIQVTTAGNYSVNVTNDVNGCSYQLKKIIQDPPVIPILDTTGPLVISTCDQNFLAVTNYPNTATGFSWYKNGILIPGATGSTYLLKSAGDYKVIRTEGNCYSLPSAVVTVTVTNAVSATGILYVNVNATGNNDGSSWANAYNNLQDAINIACLDVNQIWVAAGVYKPTTTADPGIYFSMKNNLAIYGGFAGNETTLNQRNWVTNSTTLSGDIGVAGSNEDNSNHIIYNTNLNTTAVLDGFTITGAYNAGSDGGGIVNSNSSPSISHCIFTLNYAGSGAGVLNYEFSSPIITNCKFSGNAANYGGGIYNDYLSSAVITNCSFTQNTASYGGSWMYTENYDEPVSVTNCSIIGNAGSTGLLTYGVTNITNSIVRGNGTEFENYAELIISNSNIQGGYPGTGNVDVDPLFVSITDLHLQAGSPVINAGDDNANNTTLDLDGNPRKVGTIDMGAYEYQPPIVLNTYYRDNDGDGFGNVNDSIKAASLPPGYVTNNTDCNDTDATIHPGAPETCDGKDNNCNGTIDEGFSANTYYRDADGDGYGNPSIAVTAKCAPPAGYVANNTDCNDADASIHPGAPEICDGKDNNCNGTIDEGFTANTYYRDADGDGYGNPSVTITAKCAPPAGYVTNNTDCNDADAGVHAPIRYYPDADKDGYGNPNGKSILVCSSVAPAGYSPYNTDCNDRNAAIHPGAVELCDGIDNNCDGQIDEGCALISISVNDVSITEGNTGKKTITFNVTLSQSSTKTVTVNYATANGTATAPTDYAAKSGSLSFKPGTTTQPVAVTINGDKTPEPDELFYILLSNPVNAVIYKGTGTGTIINDDGSPSAKVIGASTMQEETTVQPAPLVKLWPNPSNGIVNLQLYGYGDNVTIQLLTLYGIVLQQQKINMLKAGYGAKLNVGSYASGTYILTIMDEKGNRHVEKLIIIK